MWVYAETIPNAAYQLDIYEENNNYLGTFYDYADSGGYVSFLWDLTDGNGHTFDSTNFFGVFTVDSRHCSGAGSGINAVSHRLACLLAKYSLVDYNSNLV